MRHQLADEHNPPAIFLAFAPVHVKAEIHFVEIGMEGNCKHAQKFRAQKPKSHKACKSPAVEYIQFNSKWHIVV